MGGLRVEGCGSRAHDSEPHSSTLNPQPSTLLYSTCLFCNQPLGANEVVESFPVGRRLAFDQLPGRLWVVCRKCAKWNPGIVPMLAVEMAVNEENERRALESELALLEDAWREAEEIAAISDKLALPEGIDGRLSALKEPATEVNPDPTAGGPGGPVG